MSGGERGPHTGWTVDEFGDLAGGVARGPVLDAADHMRRQLVEVGFEVHVAGHQPGRIVAAVDVDRVLDGVLPSEGGRGSSVGRRPGTG